MIRKVERGEEGEEKEKEFDRAIVERLKELGALIDEKEKIETDVLWEHQRGYVFFLLSPPLSLTQYTDALEMYLG